MWCMQGDTLLFFLFRTVRQVRHTYLGTGDESFTHLKKGHSQ